MLLSVFKKKIHTIINNIKKELFTSYNELNLKDKLKADLITYTSLTKLLRTQYNMLYKKSNLNFSIKIK